jgi:DNA-binding MarR family transcriptional regulator
MKGKSETTRLVSLLFSMARRMKQELYKESGMPPLLHIEALRYVEEGGTRTMSDIAGYLRVSPPSATVLVDSLIGDGFMARAEDPKDRRRVRLSLSVKGKRCLASASRAREAAFSRMIAPLSKGDRAELARILSLITD